MKIEVINTGSELLLGSTLNTHGAWIGTELIRLGLRVQRQMTVPDGEAITQALTEAMSRSDAVIVTGGLGPTSDDLCREAAAEALGVDLIEDEAGLRSIEAFFARRNRPMVEINKKQALNPVGADILANPNGTAPGIYAPPRMSGEKLCALFLLPGPPSEMHPMFHTEVIPRLKALAPMEDDYQVMDLRFTGVGESDFHDQLHHHFVTLPQLEVGYCARPVEVDLRLIGPSASVQQAATLAQAHFSKECFSTRREQLEEVVVQLLAAQGKRLALAESCTGGCIASRITDVSGSSQVFTHGFVTYANEAKRDLLGVDENLLIQHGAVSEEVARAMAEGALKQANADVALSVTGIAGPTGGSPEKPVGTVWIGLATAEQTTAVKKLYPRGRDMFKQMVSQVALNSIRLELIRS